jgi:hypothetical protein
MRRGNTVFSKLAGLAACVSMLVGIASLRSASESLSQAIAKVVGVRGEVRYSEGESTSRTLGLGFVLPPGSTVLTGSNSMVDLQVITERQTATGLPKGPSVEARHPLDGNIVRVFANSRLVMANRAEFDPAPPRPEHIRLDLKEGSILGQVPALPSDDYRYEVYFPNGGLGVLRGTNAVYLVRAFGPVTALKGSLRLVFMAGHGPEVTSIGPGCQHDFDESHHNPSSLTTNAPEWKLWPLHPLEDDPHERAPGQ